MQTQTRRSYAEVRALERGLDILECLSVSGWLKPAEIAAKTGLDRASVYRLVNTLKIADYVVRREEDGAIALTSKLGELADGIHNDDLLAQVVLTHIQALTREIRWPSDFAVLSSGELMIRASTHNISPMTTQRAVLGKSRPILRSALGCAILSAMEPDQVDEVFQLVIRLNTPDAQDLHDVQAIEAILQKVRHDGYAASVGGIDPTISAIAVPVTVSKGLIGAVNIVFFRSSMSATEAAERYLPKLTEAIKSIEAQFRSATPRRIEARA